LAVRAGYRPHLITLTFEEFVDTDMDEGPAVASFARQLGLEHSVVRLSETDFLLSVDEFLQDMESPTIDGINTYLLSKACRDLGFKVAISGLGGDELFAGYPSFSRIPAMARFVSALGRSVPLRFLGALGTWAAKISHLPPKLVHASNYLSGMRDLYLLQRGIFLKEEATTVLSPSVVSEGLPKFMLAFNALTEGDAAPEPETVRLFEREVYMRNMLLKDADWAGMAHGVEIRTPLVDIALERTLCDSADRCRYSKADLSKLLAQLSKNQGPVGRKVGFSVPYQRWFVGGTIRSTPGFAIRAWCKRVLEVKFPGLTTSSESSL
jgi:asparagine synthase (glutamine-hydrolysing)